MAELTALSASAAGWQPWWHWLLGFAAFFIAGAMTLCAYHWPRSPTPGVEFVRDIVIPVGFALLACAGLVGGYALLSTR